MKRFFFLSLLTAALVGTTLTGCDYNDSDLWQAVNGLDERMAALEKTVKTTNTDLDALQKIVTALQNKVTVESVTETGNGYRIVFSDGRTAEIANGRDGAPGNVPVISVKLDADGSYYWTVDGEYLLVDGHKVRATGIDGENGQDGKDAVAPQVRINPTTGEWEISTDGGTTWNSTGVTAQGPQGPQGEPGAPGQNGEGGDSLFKEVNVDDPACVTFTLSDGTTFTLLRSADIVFTIVREGTGAESFAAGMTKTFAVEASGVADFMITRPEGWSASYADAALTITAPAADNPYAERRGDVAVMVVAANGASRIVKLPVEMYELRVLTFEDEDYKGTGNYLGNSDWSSLIDTPQYGGPLLYGDYSNCEYNWYDENNTFLASEFPENWGSKVYWGGGHAVSNYVDMDLSHGSFEYQLSVYSEDPVTGFGGHKGSKNFCVHYGYRDNSGYSAQNLPFIYFGDGEARTVDHMYVMITTYLANCLANGNGLTAPAGPDDYVRIVAIGYDAEGKEIALRPEIYLVGEKGNVTEWTKWDLSALGKVTMIEFNMEGSNDNGYGFSQPAYFAYDDVAVRF